MSPEQLNALATANQHLSDAKAILSLGITHVAAREAYLAAFPAAEAFIESRTGRAVKTHSSLRSVLSRMARDEPRIDPSFTQFLANAYDLKSLADYAAQPALKISAEQADSTVQTADRLIAAIAGLLNQED